MEYKRQSKVKVFFAFYAVPCVLKVPIVPACYELIITFQILFNKE
jgi:hypothetical protein